MNAVELAGVTVELGGRRVLGPLDLALPEGSWTVIVGPSGCGKTTLLRLVAGLERPSAGTLRLAGRPASADGRLLLPPEQRSIGFVFQGAGAGLWPHLSARATLEFVLACRGVARPERRTRAAELLERVGLAGLAERRPGELSGGEAQRLALARALAVEPRLLLLDEPLGALDLPLRATLAETLAGIHARLAPTILYVTHDPREVAGHATRTLALRAGRLEEAA
ncbi:MAG TPA: ATP-binding cassette domain-containing protein [Planctomycetota bacterium]